MNPKSFSSLIVSVLLLFAFFELGVCREERFLSDDVKSIPIVPGGEQEDLARFAVDDYNQKEKTQIEFVKLVDVKEQVVDGKMYYLSFEGKDGDKTKLYEAIVLYIPWKNNFKEVEVFKEIDQAHIGSPEHNPFNLGG